MVPGVFMRGFGPRLIKGARNSVQGRRADDHCRTRHPGNSENVASSLQENLHVSMLNALFNPFNTGHPVTHDLNGVSSLSLFLTKSQKDKIRTRLAQSAPRYYHFPDRNQAYRAMVACLTMLIMDSISSSSAYFCLKQELAFDGLVFTFIMQHATHHRLHVRDAHDAHVVFEAVRQGFLSPITRRLNDMERHMLVRSGAIFVWVESEDETQPGLKRWTDGRVWGQSRMREPYLFYDERLPADPMQGRQSPQTFRFVDSSPRSGPTSSALSHQDRNINQHSGLVKQAYSAWVTSHPHHNPQKWHLTAYFAYADLSTLPTIDQDPLLRKIIVPSGIYRSGTARSRGEEEESSTRRHLSTSQSQHMIPTLPSLHLTVNPTGERQSQQHGSHGGRLAEDERVIQMLNSRYI